MCFFSDMGWLVLVGVKGVCSILFVLGISWVVCLVISGLSNCLYSVFMFSVIGSGVCGVFLGS